MSSSSNETSRQKAYAFIQKKLLDGEIRAGDLVSELALAAEIGMSRTPVREAIGQLEIEGLFDKVARVGTIVRLPDRRELRELYQVREALEGHAAHEAASVLDSKSLDMMENLQQELNLVAEELASRELEFLDEALLHRFFNADIGFHSVIAEATDNRRMLKIINEFRVIQRVFEYDRMDYSYPFLESVALEHGEVLAALRGGNGEDAQRAMVRHISASLDHALAGWARRDAAQLTASSVASVVADASHAPSKSKRKFRRPLSSLQQSV